MVKAIILLSGGLDSTVVLALAASQGKNCLAVSFDYQQKHRQELEAAKKIASYYDVPHQMISLDPTPFSLSSLTSDLAVPQARTLDQISNAGTPNTYVPARNTIFLAYALGICEHHDADEIHFGPNRADITCYPDCTPAYLKAFQAIMNQATKQAITSPPQLVTPLISLNKPEIIQLGIRLKAPLDMTWSCYSPTKASLPCQTCDACVLRSNAFNQL